MAQESSATKLERYRGSLLGLAVGDALGTTLEFQSPGTFMPIDDIVGGGPFNLSPGQWTDDTSMALCLAERSRTTHGARSSIDACGYLGSLIISAVRGYEKETILSEGYCPVPGNWQKSPLTEEITEIAGGSFKRLHPSQIKGSGYVVRSLEATLWAFYNNNIFREGCLLTANLGDDADTTAAVYGQLAGAFCGEKAITTRWRRPFAHHSIIESFAEQLYEIAWKKQKRRMANV